ncbi:MAG: ROK family protein, partial [Micromonosporaceae bacterium]
TGEVQRLHVEPTQASLGGRFVLERCGRLVAELNRDRLPIGVGLCELIDRDGQIRSGVTVDWRRLDVAAALGTVTLESDVRAAALAEARFGAGRGKESFLYLSIGTGVAHTLVLGGQPYRGAHGYALMVGAPPIEFTSSGAALTTAAGTDPRTALNEPAHRDLLDSAGQSLGQALAFLIHALDPEVVVIGGGLGLNPRYRSRIAEAARGYLYADRLAETPILAAGLGTSAGVVGAALTAAPHI